MLKSNTIYYSELLLDQELETWEPGEIKVRVAKDRGTG